MKYFFPNILINNQKYPSVILGEDLFTGWFPKCVNNKYKNEEERESAYLEVLEQSYNLGVRGFSISPHKTLVRILKQFKKDNPDTICIANPHYNSHYYLNDKLLWDKSLLEKANNTVKLRLGLSTNNNDALSKDEINQISINTHEFAKQLSVFNEFCDYCIVGNLGYSVLQILERLDIVRKEIELVKENNLIPLGICEAGVDCLKLMKDLDVSGYWIKINKDLPKNSQDELVKEIKLIKKPITAYKIFSQENGFNFEKSMKFIKSIPEVKSIVVGVENQEQAKETFSKLKDWF